MTSTIERLEWATKTSNGALGDGLEYKRRLDARADLRATTGEHVGTCDGLAAPIGFELSQGHDDGQVILEAEETTLSWLLFGDPGAVRVLAAALLEAADEWERVTGDVL